MMKIKNLKSFFFVILILMCISLRGQKNTFSFSYTPAITKLNFNDEPKNNGISGGWRIYFESKTFDMPAYGSNIGFYYNHRFGKLSIGLGLLLTELRQQSGLYYQWRGFSSYPEGYAGTNYVMTYDGVELPLVFDYLLKQKNRFNFSIDFTFSFNAMVRFTLKDYIVEKKSGIYRAGCCTTFIGEDSKTFETLEFIINEKRLEYVRISSSIGFKVDYSLYRNLSISITPIIKYYSNSLKKADNTFSLDADAFLFGTQLNLNFNF